MKPLHVIRATKQKKEDDLLAIDGVTGVDVGKKIVKGKKTAENAIRVYVKKKQKNIPENLKIPEEIDGVKTDVIEATFELHSMAVALAEIERKADTGTYDPLLGGISIGPCGAVGGYIYTGTLGCMVKDRDTKEILMMTNYHVLAEKWSVGEQVVQPSRVDTGSCPSDLAGSLLRSVISENVDGAVARIANRSHKFSIHEIGDVKGKNTAAVDMKVRKRGRTTGYTHGTVDSIDATVSVPYDDGNHILRNQILIDVDKNQSTQFGNSGDSGSVVVDEDNKVVGLYFAGNSDGSLGVANPIDAVLNELNVDLCVTPVLKSILHENKTHWSENLKYIFEESWKNRIKELSYEKPPYAEGMDWDWRWRVTNPMTGSRMEPTQTETCVSNIDARLTRLEALITQHSHDSMVKDPFKEKTELKEFKEKPEYKELKEKPEYKELKEKPEYKELKEKPEYKELKEKEFKEKPEHKELFEGGDRFPDIPLLAPMGPSSGADPLKALETRLARLEGLLGQRHFIDQSLRPDLSKGALMREPDQC